MRPQPCRRRGPYRGKDGREVMVQYAAHGAATAGTMGRRVPQVMDRMLHGASGAAQQGTDDGGGMASKVMGSVGPGPWDNSNWFPQGQLMVYKGDQMIGVDMVAANGGKDGAVDLATKAVARLPQPLDYDGAKAVAAAPAPVKRVPACDLVPRAKAEAILGSLKGDPTPDSTDTQCTYKVASADGDVSYTMGISWTQGYKGLNMLKRGNAMTAGSWNRIENLRRWPSGGGVDRANDCYSMPKLDEKSQKMLNGFTKALGMPGMGAAVSRGLAPDTALVGPMGFGSAGERLLAARQQGRRGIVDDPRHCRLRQRPKRSWLRRVRSSMRALVTATSLPPSGGRDAAAQSAERRPPKITLVKGMRIGWAWRGDSIEGDYTPSMTVTNVDPSAVTIISNSYKGKKGGGMENVVLDTKMLRSAMATGPIYRQIWISTDPLVMQGTTSMVLSDTVMHDIRPARRRSRLSTR